MKEKKKHTTKLPYHQMSFWQLIRQLIISRLPRQKEKISDEPIIPEPSIPKDQISYIAIVLDGVVEDVMRAQNRLAALLLSNPEFVEFDPESNRVHIGHTRYSDGKFSNEGPPLMTDNEIEDTLRRMGVEKDENQA